MKEKSVFKWIYTHCGGRLKEGVVLVLLNAWSALCVTIFAILSKRVMDSAQIGDKEELIKNSIFLFCLIISQILARVTASLVEAISQGKAEINLRTSVFFNILRGNYADNVEKHSGDLMTRLTADVQMVSDNYVHIFPASIAFFVRILSGAIALYHIDKNFAKVFIICGALVVVFAAISRKYLKKLHRSVQEKDSRVRSFMQEMLENLFAVKVFGIEDKVMSRSVRQQKRFYREKVKKKGFSIIAGIGFSLAFAVGFLAAVAYGSYGVLNGTMTFGAVVAIVQLVNQLQSPVVGITGVLPSFFAMTTSAQRLMEICNENAETVEDVDINYDDFVKIKVRDAVFGYGDEKVFSHASFTVNKGEFIGIQGPSGAGKSTVLKLITGLYPVDEGKVTVETKHGEYDCKKTRKLFSFVPQGNMLFSGTIRENLTILSPGATEEEIRNALVVAAAEFAYDLEDGLDFMLGESGAGISEGQAQRIAIARAILANSGVLLMDESTSALDAETEKIVIENLQKKEDITVIIITHREAVLDKCDRLITVANGKIEEK